MAISETSGLPTGEAVRSPLQQPKLDFSALKDLRPEIVHDETAPGGSIQLYRGNCLNATAVLPRSMTSLIVTSPPYPGVTQPEEDYATFPDPKKFNAAHDFLEEVWRVCWDLLQDLGHLCINIYDIPAGAGGMFPNVAGVLRRCTDIGFVLREKFIWAKGASYSPPSGSWPYPKGVLAANTFEEILVFQKPLQFSQRKGDKANEGDRERSKLGKEEHAWLMDPVWHISSEREGRKLGHPFTYPSELVERLIKLYTFWGEWVVDPFAGSATTLLAARNLGRMAYGFEVSDKYIEIAKKRLGQGTLL